MQLLLQCDYLKIEEDKLWTAVLKWAEVQSSEVCGARNGEIDLEPPRKRRRLNTNGNAVLQCVAPFIRFGLMDIRYFAEKVEPTGCLSNEEVIAVFKYIAMREINPDFECDKFSTKKRGIMTLRKFEFYSSAHHQLLNGGLEIRGATTSKASGGCEGYFVYPETSQPGGFTKGIHFWTVLLVKQYCWRCIGLVAERRSIDRISNAHGTDSANFTHYNYNYNSWESGDTVTVVLDCDDGKVHYHKNEQKAIQTQALSKDKPYFFALVLCARPANHVRVVSTPESIVSRYYSQ